MTVSPSRVSPASSERSPKPQAVSRETPTTPQRQESAQVAARAPHTPATSTDPANVSDLFDKVGRLMMEHLDQRQPAIGRDAALAVLAEFRTAVDDVRAVLDAFDREAAETATKAGAVLKRCAKCRHFMVVGGPGRPRRYCSDECKSAARQVKP